MAFCLYVAARVFVQYLKSRKDDVTVLSSLNFLLSAMQALKAKNPLTESFLVQLDVDLEGSGLDIPLTAARNPNGSFKFAGEIPQNTDSVHCSPLFEIRISQAAEANARVQLQAPLRTANDMPVDFSAQDFTSSHMNEMGYFNQNPSQRQMPQRSRPTLPDNANTQFDRNNSLSDLGVWNEVTAQQPGSGRNSGHPTPSASTTSNKDSSHTSFTPPQFDDGSTSYAGFNAFSPNTCARIMDPYGQSSNKSGPEGMNTSFALPAGWDFSADGPANTGTGSKENNSGNFSSGTGLTPGPTGLTPFMSSDGDLQNIHDIMNSKKANPPGTSNQADWMFTTGWDGGSDQQR